MPTLRFQKHYVQNPKSTLTSFQRIVFTKQAFIVMIISRTVQLYFKKFYRRVMYQKRTFCTYPFIRIVLFKKSWGPFWVVPAHFGSPSKIQQVQNLENFFAILKAIQILFETGTVKRSLIIAAETKGKEASLRM